MPRTRAAWWPCDHLDRAAECARLGGIPVTTGVTAVVCTLGRRYVLPAVVLELTRYAWALHPDPMRPEWDAQRFAYDKDSEAWGADPGDRGPIRLVRRHPASPGELVRALRYTDSSDIDF